MEFANQTQTENFKRGSGCPDSVQFGSLDDVIPLDPPVLNHPLNPNDEIVDRSPILAG